MNRILTALVLVAMVLGVTLVAQSSLMNLPGKVDANYALAIVSSAEQGPYSPQMALSNLPGVVDANGALKVTFGTGDIVGGGNLQVAAGGVITYNGRTRLSSPADSTFLLTNNAGTDFARLQLGGTTSSFPSFKRSSAAIQVRLADDSALTTLQAGNLQASTFAPLATGARLISDTAPTISSGFGTSPSVSANNGTAAFRVNVGTGGVATSGVIGLPAATTGWNCFCSDITTNTATSFLCKQTASTTTTATVGNFSTAGVAATWSASDVLAVSCFAY